MESFVYSITVMASAIFLIVIIQLIRGRLAELEKSGAIRAESTSPERSERTDSSDTMTYGPIDCFDDCMHAFKWRPKEEVECAKACGLDRLL